jgi:phosphoadenosine phosphosulfate reductase
MKVMEQQKVVSISGEPVKVSLDFDLAKVNQHLREASPTAIIQWALGLAKRTIATTSFGYDSALMLHQLSQVDPRVPVVWIDTGYNTRDTYLVAQRLIEDLSLNIHIYTPDMTSARRDAMMGIPTPDDEVLHKEFTRQVKLEPFQRALDEFRPEVWFSGLRQEETDFRKNLDIVSWDSRGILKVAPIFYWSDDQVEDYMDGHKLPSCKRYFDPTKVHDSRECGMHTGA